jgi:hypothetical protein
MAQQGFVQYNKDWHGAPRLDTAQQGLVEHGKAGL